MDLLDQICTPNVVQHDPSTQGDLRGPRALKEQIQEYRHGMSDLELAVDDVIATEDKVITRWHGHGTNDGEMMGMPPTGMRAEVTGITIDRFDSAGRITETWSQWDNLDSSSSSVSPSRRWQRSRTSSGQTGSRDSSPGCRSASVLRPEFGQQLAEVRVLLGAVARERLGCLQHSPRPARTKCSGPG